MITVHYSSCKGHHDHIIDISLESVLIYTESVIMI